MEINFKTHNPAIDNEQIKDFQRRWAINLPPCYYEFLLNHNGGCPLAKFFSICGFAEPAGSVQAFFGLGTSIKTSDLDWRISNRMAPFPRGLLEIALLLSRLFCLSFSDPHGPDDCEHTAQPAGGHESLGHISIHPSAPRSTLPPHLLTPLTLPSSPSPPSLMQLTI